MYLVVDTILDHSKHFDTYDWQKKRKKKHLSDILMILITHQKSMVTCELTSSTEIKLLITIPTDTLRGS